MSTWEGHRDLCPTQWGEDCDCITPEERAAFCICGYVDGDEGRDPGIRHFEDCPNFENPCKEHNRYPCHKCGQDAWPRREQVLRRVDDAVEDL